MIVKIASPVGSISLSQNARQNAALRIAALLLVVATGWATRRADGWVAMWALAAAEFFALKLLTLQTWFGGLADRRVVAYIALWPGMNAREFLGTRIADRPARAELFVALTKLVLGLLVLVWATHLIGSAPELLAGWIGMLGLVFALHFGALHAVSWIWRAAGVTAPPIMRAPMASRSIAEFWGERWNIAFAESARRFVLRPLSRRWGVRLAGFAVFLLSGLIHETVISLPARGGWGGPTLYFLIQAAGIAVEKSPFGKRFRLARGVRGWLWSLVVTALPVPLLFHEPFVRNVIVPFLQTLAHFLP